MEIVIVSRRRLRRRTLRFGLASLLIPGLIVAVAAVTSSFYLGYRSAPSESRIESELYAAAWKGEVVAQRTLVAEAIAEAHLNLDTLAARVGRLQAHIMRVDNLGARLVEMAKLDAEEFAFDRPPAMGGPRATDAVSPSVPDFLSALSSLALDLDDRLPKLRVVETALRARQLDAEVVPSGRPVLTGWLSSAFGNRTDPMTGQKSFHAGLDFAGRSGTDILAVASGLVVWSGSRQGYGRMVELDHGNGFSTIYAHNRRNRVKVGDTVRKGEVIAEMGASGRATGTHVHFEVLRNGRPVNPLDYVRAGG